MKLSTLVKIAREIEAEHKCTARGTVNEMWNRLEVLCKGIRTKAEAKKLIADKIYDIQ